LEQIIVVVVAMAGIAIIAKDMAFAD